MRADCKLTTILDDKTSEQRIEVSSAKIDVIQFEKTGISDVKMLYNTGDRHDPWGHPAIISVFCERVVPKYTLNFRWEVEFFQFEDKTVVPYRVKSCFYIK